MENNICFFHYNNAIDAMNKGSVVAVNSVWLFIKNLIIAAYGGNYIDESNANVDLINENIHDIKLRNMIHEIRKERNNYEHNNMITCSNETIERWNSTVNYLIKYVNETTVTGYKFKLKQIDTIGTPPISKIINKDNELIEKNSQNNSITYIRSRQTRMSDMYYIAYGDSESVFSITGNFSFDNKYSVFSVIHNILTRGKTIIESDFLKSKGLPARDLEIIYVLEIIILRAITEGLCDDGKLFVSSIHKELVKLAYQDIKYLCLLIENMSDQRINFPVIKFENFENEFEAGRTKPNCGRNIVAKILIADEQPFLMPKLFSTHINYTITPQNIAFFCTILKLLFGYTEFKDGQLAALQSIFNSNDTNMIILPTGYGKSLIYQYYALIQPQVTIVVSPTDCLIYDQIINLKSFGITEIPQLDKTIIARGYSYELFGNLIYSTPDVLESENVFSLINGLYKRNLLNAIAIDESHQVSVWGHCFDANYFTLLHQIKNEFQGTKFLLFSATASQRIKEDLEQQFYPLKLNILQPCPLLRNHISYNFKRFASDSEIFNDIKEVFEHSYGSQNEYDISNSLELPKLTLIICNDFSVLSKLYKTLCESETVIDQLTLYKGEKSKYNSFRLAHKKILLTDDTNLAGINIPFLRNVIIIGFPPSKEWFYQECGRVGRNGEKSNVIVYSNNRSFDSLITEIPHSFNDSEKALSLKHNNIDFSNSKFISSFLFTENDSKMTSELLNEIYKCVYVRDEESFGTVIGRMGSGERGKYDKALFLLYYCGIIEKWLFNKDNTYRFYINMNIDDGPKYFKSKSMSKIKLQSGNDEVLEKNIAVLSACEDFSSLFTSVAKWISENGYFIRKQMFINTLQLAFDAVELTDDEIEKNLALYFSIGHTKTKKIDQKVKIDILNLFENSQNKTSDFEECELKKDVKKTEIINRETITLLEDTSSVCDVASAEKTEVLKDDISEVSFTLSNNVGDSLFIEKPVISVASNSNRIESLKQSIDVDINDIENITSEKVKNNDFDANNSQEKLISWIKEISQNKSILNDQFCTILKKIEDYPIEELAFIKMFIEREIEYKFSKNLLILLSIIELVKDRGSRIHRTQVVFDNLSDAEVNSYLKLIRDHLSYSQKNQIDDILQKKGKSKVFYKGFVGIVKKLLKL